MNMYEKIKDNLKESDTGYDYWGSKAMEPFKGKAYIQYYGGPGALEYLHRARNGRYIWKDSSYPEEPYFFNSYEDALKVQKEVGGEIMSYQKDWLGEELNEMDNSEGLTNIQFEEYCKDKIGNLGTVPVKDFDGNNVDIRVAFEQPIRDYGNCKVLNNEDTIDKLDSDGENLEFVTEKGEYVNTPMISPITLVGRLEFTKIDEDFYKSMLQYWDEFKDLFESDKLKEAEVGEATYGSVEEIDGVKYYVAGSTSQGYCFKDINVYENDPDGVCYICEHMFSDDEHSVDGEKLPVDYIESNKDMLIHQGGISTHNSIKEEVRGMLAEGWYYDSNNGEHIEGKDFDDELVEHLAYETIDIVDWQSTGAYIFADLDNDEVIGETIEDFYDKKFNESDNKVESIHGLENGKSYWAYVSKHGIGPGTMPKDVNPVCVTELPNTAKTLFCIDRELTPEEMNKYEIALFDNNYFNKYPEVVKELFQSR